ncbi:MAG TPA: protein translocase subunit SecF [Rectinemataceae bacterium]|nr:protein translocase subunit SecF [Rectinemataceae bacterium]
MKRVIQWHRSFKFLVPMSIAIIAAGLVTVAVVGFRMGIDFQAGINTDVQFAPPSMDVAFDGTGTMRLTVSQSDVTLISQAPSGESKSYTYTWASAPTLQAMATDIAAVPGVHVNLRADGATASSLLLGASQTESTLSTTPTVLHYRSGDASVLAISVEDLRAKMKEFGNVSIQRVGDPANREFIIRVEDSGKDPTFSQTIHSRFVNLLSSAYGADNVIVNSSTVVGARFSQQLATQAIWMTILMFSVILVYCSVRFKPIYAIAAVISVMHDALIMVSFIVFTRIELNTTVIAAVLTIVGYSINDKIVIDDRIREKVKLNPNARYRDNMNLGVTETLGRTVITAGTVLLSAVGLYVFTTGAMKDFALCIIIGVISGTYSSVFIGSAFVDNWMLRADKKSKKEHDAASGLLQDKKTKKA